MKNTLYFKTEEEKNQYYPDGVPSNILAIVGEKGVLYTSSNNREMSGTMESQGGYNTDPVDSARIDALEGDVAKLTTEKADANDVYTKTEVNSLLAGVDVDLTGYASESYVANYVATYAPTPDLSAYVSKSELNECGYTTGWQYVGAANDNMFESGNTYITSNSSYVLFNRTKNHTYHPNSKVNINSEKLLEYYVPNYSHQSHGLLSLNENFILSADTGSNLGGYPHKQLMLSTNGYVFVSGIGGATDSNIKSNTVTYDMSLQTVISNLETAVANAGTPDMSDYVSKTELSAASYITNSVLNNRNYLTKTGDMFLGDFYPSKNNTYSLGNSNYLFRGTYSNNYYMSSGKRIGGSVNSGITSLGFYINSDELYTMTNIALFPQVKGKSLGLTRYPWSVGYITNAYTSNVFINDENIKDMFPSYAYVVDYVANNAGGGSSSTPTVAQQNAAWQAKWYQALNTVAAQISSTLDSGNWSNSTVKLSSASDWNMVNCIGTTVEAIAMFLLINYIYGGRDVISGVNTIFEAVGDINLELDYKIPHDEHSYVVIDKFLGLGFFEGEVFGGPYSNKYFFYPAYNQSTDVEEGKNTSASLHIKSLNRELDVKGIYDDIYSLLTGGGWQIMLNVLPVIELNDWNQFFDKYTIKAINTVPYSIRFVNYGSSPYDMEYNQETGLWECGIDNYDSQYQYFILEYRESGITMWSMDDYLSQEGAQTLGFGANNGADLQQVPVCDLSSQGFMLGEGEGQGKEPNKIHYNPNTHHIYTTQEA